MDERVDLLECRLCFENSADFINLFDGSEYSKFVVNVVSEHIGEAKDSDQLPKVICLECWHKTETFHTFHRSVQSAQSNYLIKFVKSEFHELEQNHAIENVADIKMPSFIEVPQNGQNFEFECEFEEVKPEKILDACFAEVLIDADNQEKNAMQSVDVPDEFESGEANFDYTCDMCGIDQRTFEQALLHYSEQHNVEGYIKCCERKFYTESSVSDHIAFHKDPDAFKCEQCGKRLSSKRMYYKHKSWHNGPKKFTCDICNRSYTYKDRLKHHMITQHIRVTKCILCFKRVSGNEELQAHEKLCHSPGATVVAKEQFNGLKEFTPGKLDTAEVEQIVAKYFDLSCDLCDDGFESNSFQQTQYHFMQAHPDTDGYIKCCNKKFKNKVDIFEHVPYHMNKEICRCRVCGEQTTLIKDLRRHLDKHMRIKEETDGTLTRIHLCKRCNQQFNSVRKLELHIKETHSREYRRREKIGEDKLNIKDFFDMSCSHNECTNVQFSSLQEAKLHYFEMHGNPDGFLRCCNLQFKANKHIQDHLRYHLNPDEYICDICGKQFITQSQIAAHKSKHKALDEQRYVCHVCKKLFTSKYHLDHHVLIHRKKTAKPKKERLFPCSSCNRKFSNATLRESHETRIHLKPSDFKEEICEFCAKTFRTKSDVVAHVRRVHDKNPKIQCEICKAWLTTRYTLKTHMLNHSSDPQKCPHCDKTSPNIGALNQHIQKFHIQKRIHKCQLCDKSFKELTSLRSHLGTHTGERMYKCSFCPESFIWRPNMYSHQKKAHPLEWNESKKQKNTS